MSNVIVVGCGRVGSQLANMLSDREARARWQAKALSFADTADIYSNAERAAELILQEP